MGPEHGRRGGGGEGARGAVAGPTGWGTQARPPSAVRGLRWLFAETCVSWLQPAVTLVACPLLQALAEGSLDRLLAQGLSRAMAEAALLARPERVAWLQGLVEELGRRRRQFIQAGLRAHSMPACWSRVPQVACSSVAPSWAAGCRSRPRFVCTSWPSSRPADIQCVHMACRSTAPSCT